jgi:hypothetical protein
MKTSSQEEYAEYIFLLSGEDAPQLTFQLDASTVGIIMAILTSKGSCWYTFNTKDGLVCVDFSKITAIFPSKL